MGIDIYVLNFLLTLPEGDLGNVLCLGRQGFHIPRDGTQWHTAQEILARRDTKITLDEIRDEDGYADRFFKYLGARTVVSLDLSPFEHANILHDLNKSVPDELKNRFDFIFDGGTLEHIYNLPAAFQNIQVMLRKGGLFASINAANNQLGHGFYQFSPELYWRTFTPEVGFTIERMQLVPITASGVPLPVDIADSIGTRQEIGATPHPTYVMVAARRLTSEVLDIDDVYQADYVAAWDTAAKRVSTQEAADPITPEMTLTQLADRHGSDKGTQWGARHRYTQLYDLVFCHIREEPITLLEIGLAEGGPEVGGRIDRRAELSPSVSMWLDYFPSAQIVGFDITDFSHIEHERFLFVQGDCGSSDDLARLANAADYFDLVIDDASHASYHQQLAFRTLFPKVVSGGLYIIEDLHWQSSHFELSLPPTPLTSILFEAFMRKLEYIPNPIFTEIELTDIVRTIRSYACFPSFHIEGEATGPKLIVIRKV